MALSLLYTKDIIEKKKCPYKITYAVNYFSGEINDSVKVSKKNSREEISRLFYNKPKKLSPEINNMDSKNMETKRVVFRNK